MKTNQMMEVNIGKFGNVMIGHLTQMGKLNEILDIGNSIREQKGLKAKSLHTYLRSKNTWELILKVYNEENKKEFGEFTKKSDNEKEFGQMPKKSDSDNNTFSANAETLLYQETLDNLPQDIQGRIKYTEIAKTKIFDKVFKIQNRGKLVNRGTWANLFVMLDLAQWLDVDLRYEIYRVFIEEKLLMVRDDGGEEFKRLNKLLDTLPDRANKDNKGVYIQVAKKVNEKIKGEFKQTWNKEGDDSVVQNKRDELLDKLSFAIEYNFITSYPQVKEMIETYKF